MIARREPLGGSFPAWLLVVVGAAAAGALVCVYPSHAHTHIFTHDVLFLLPFRERLPKPLCLAGGRVRTSYEQAVIWTTRSNTHTRSHCVRAVLLTSIRFKMLSKNISSPRSSYLFYIFLFVQLYVFVELRGRRGGPAASAPCGPGGPLGFWLRSTTCNFPLDSNAARTTTATTRAV